jgi:tRNA threonylcarbamoyl adenosine modification protein YjeE
MRTFGLQLGKQLRANDYIVLNGALGAGKTTFTQGLGVGLNVTGSITSPTFVVSRIHPSAANGFELIHIDAYRLTSGDQLLDLDLEDHPNSVVVMEWGAPYIEVITDTWLQIDIERTSEIDIANMNNSDPAAGERLVKLTAFGNRWKELDTSVLT